MGIAGAAEEMPLDLIRAQMETNYFGTLTVGSKVLPRMREQGKGLFIVVGSIAGKVPIPMQSLWGMEQAVYGTGSFVLLWDKSTLTVNGEQRFNTYVPAESGEPFDYRRNEYYRFVTNLSNENHFLIGVSAVVLVVFLFLAYRSRRQMHKRFLDRISAGTYAEEGPPDENNGKEEGTDVGG